MQIKNMEMSQEMKVRQDKVRGSLLGGAVGDALGYPVEFWDEESIFYQYGEYGIQGYELDERSGKALISDDTQMTLFTANGILAADTKAFMDGIKGTPHDYLPMSYQDWLRTQEASFHERKEQSKGCMDGGVSWLLDVPGLYSCRDSGFTCISKLGQQKNRKGTSDSFIAAPQNDSKGCGGIMRVAPLALKGYPHMPIKDLDREGAEIAAITHGHPLGYMTAAILVHIVHRIVYPEKTQTLKEIIIEARDMATEIFAGDEYLKELTDIIDLSVSLSENGKKDLDNIHQIGEGWVAEETLGIAIDCSLRYQGDFSAGVIASVNHDGDSDSTGAVTGNILGAFLGHDAIDEKWKRDLELSDVILEMADDLCYSYQMDGSSHYGYPDWIRKYTHMQWKDE